MSSYNRVILMGNLTRDPELKFLTSGTPVANFGIAMNESYTDQSGEKRDSVCFVEVEAWQRQAEIIGEHFTKGKPILIEGSLKYESWEDAEGTKRNKLKVRLQRFQFVGGKNGDDETNDGTQSAPPQVPATPQVPSTPVDSVPPTTANTKSVGTEDDIPF